MLSCDLRLQPPTRPGRAVRAQNKRCPFLRLFGRAREETIRFVKQCYGFEHIRVMSYESWRNMSALVLATAYFTAAWLGRGVRKDVLVAHIEHMHQRFNDVPEFVLYALADGIRRAFSRYGTWETKAVTKPKPPKDSQPDLPGWNEIAFLGAG